MADDAEVRWDRLSAPALRDAVKDKTVVIIPLGATEQHGPHLPTQVDWRSAYEISLRAARLMAGRQRALVTPAIPFGMSEHHMSLGGTLTLDYATMAAVIGCVVRSAARQLLDCDMIFVFPEKGTRLGAEALVAVRCVEAREGYSRLVAHLVLEIRIDRSPPLLVDELHQRTQPLAHDFQHRGRYIRGRRSDHLDSAPSSPPSSG